jgi:hypothetical protein
LIGLLKEKFLQLKIKVNADHVGLSVLPVFFNHGHWLEVQVSAYLNNNLLIVQDHMEITDAMEDGHQVPSITLKLPVLLHNLNIHIELLTKTALEMEEVSN